MTITPDELRNVTFRESLRGYHRADVEAICERAAATIEHLEQQVRTVQRDGNGDGQPESVRVVRPTDRSVVHVDDDTIQRTLILAQKAADEAVREAGIRADRLTAESEATAHALVTEAEATARRIGEQERRRIEADVERLGAARESLHADVDALERFTAEFRARIRRAIEGELARLDDASVLDVDAPRQPAGSRDDEPVGESTA